MPDLAEAIEAPPQEDVEQDEATTAPVDEKPDYGPNFEKLPEEKIEELQSIIQTCSQRDQWARMVEVIRCTLRRFFWLGIQHGFWNADAQQMQIGPNGGSFSGGENLNEEDLFAGDFNIYTQNGKIFISVFSQSGAPSRMEPDKPGDPESEKAAEEAEKYVRVYQKYNPPKVAQQEVGRLLWTDGRVVAMTCYEENEEMGTDENGEGDPVPRGTEITKYGGVLEWKVPMLAEFAKWPFCCYSRELDVLTAKCDNPDFADELQTGTKGTAPNNEIARMSRIAVGENVSQVSSDTVAYMLTEDTWWLRPSAFYDLDKDKRAFWIGAETKDEDGNVTMATEGIFPKGCRVKFFGDVYCGAKAVSMSDEVRVMHAMPGTGNARPSLSDPLIPIQMEFNDAVGMYSELLHKCIPRIWVNAQPEEMQAIMEQVARYGEYSPMTKGDGLPLEQQFFPEPQIDVPASFGPWVENLQGPLAQFVTGNSPALFGQQMEDQKTATGYAQARDQSLGLMALVWVPYLEFAAGIRGQAARCAATRDKKIAAVVDGEDGDSEAISIDPAVMKAGFLSTPVTDQNFPESWTETSNTWKALKAASIQDPDLAADLQLPENKRGFRDAIGLKNFVNRTDDSRNIQLQEWAKIQKDGDPLPDDEATQARDQQKQQVAQTAMAAVAPGQEAPPLPEQPPIMRSTVPIDVDTDDHVVHALEMFRILNSADGQAVKLKTPGTWQNGKLHMLAHVAAAKAKGLMVPPPLGGAPGLPPPGALPPGGPQGGPTPPAPIAPIPTPGALPPGAQGANNAAPVQATA